MVDADVGGTRRTSAALRLRWWACLRQVDSGRAFDAWTEWLGTAAVAVEGWPAEPGLWADPEWRGALLAPHLVEQLRRRDAAERTGFPLANLSRRVAVVAAAWAVGRDLGSGELGVLARRRRYRDISGRDDCADLRERPRSDDAAKMAAVAARLSAGLPALGPPAPATGSKAALRPEAFETLHREAHGCAGTCPHMDAVLRFALQAPLLWLGDPAPPSHAPSAPPGDAARAAVLGAKVAELVGSGVLAVATDAPLFVSPIFVTGGSSLVGGPLVEAARASMESGDWSPSWKGADLAAAAMVGAAAGGSWRTQRPRPSPRRSRPLGRVRWGLASRAWC
jgi:hypothetical protein